MTNIEKVRSLFLNKTLNALTNSDISRITGITPHQQVFQITQKLVNEGLLRIKWRNNEKVFYLASSIQGTPCVGNIILDVGEEALSHKPQKDILTGGENSTPSMGNYQLPDIGFEEAGNWYLDNGNLQYKLLRYRDERNILYAFIAQEKVMYIGKSTQTLTARMNGYRRPGPTQSTNIKDNARIKELLGKDISVQIFVLVQKEQLLHRDIPINLAAGLEDNLLAQINPPWNERGTTRKLNI
jgi:hypothetical protein